jgi:exosortase family protein XrtM
VLWRGPRLVRMIRAGRDAAGTVKHMTSRLHLRFGITFLLSFALLMGAFEASRGSAFERFVIQGAILIPTMTVINTVTPAEHVELDERTLTSPDGANLRVTRGCEGVEMFLLLIAAIVAFPASAPHRLQGLLVGSLLAYVLTVARLMTLHYVLRYAPRTWEAVHGLILPLAPIVLLSFYFLHWTAQAAATRGERMALAT